MKRLLMVVAAALLTFSGPVQAQGPDDKYIEIYRLMHEGDQLAGSGQSEMARQRYVEAQTELKKLQTNYPTWNTKLIEFRLRALDLKLRGPAGAAAPSPGRAPASASAPAPAQSPTPALAPRVAPVVAPVPSAQPQTPVPSAPQPPAEADDRDRQISVLQEQVARLQNDRAVLEAKLREALAAQPAAIDPRELAKAEERIRALEKDKEVLLVSVAVAESRATQQNQSGMAELNRALAEARQKLAEQNDVVMALRQERDVLQQSLRAARQTETQAVDALRAENENLKKQIAEKPAPVAERGSEAAERELESTRAALQSSRDTVSSLQTRLRALQDERDSLDKVRKDLESRMAANAQTTAPSVADTEQLSRLQAERDDLQRKLSEAARQLAESKDKVEPAIPAAVPTEELTGLRARLQVLEARKVPYTAEELALFKKPAETVAVSAEVPKPAASKQPPVGSATLLAEAQRAFTARRFDEAEKKYLEVLRLDDRNVSTLQRLAAAQLEQSRPQDAEVQLKRALEQDPKDARTLLLMGIAKFDQNQFDEAFNHLSRSAQADPGNAETQNYLGITLSQKGQRAAAETALRKAIQLSPNYASAHYNLAVVYATQQPPFAELARWHYQKALAFGHSQNEELEKMMDREPPAAQK